MASVTLDQIRKVYDNGFVAVHGADMHVEDGEFVVLVGPSGCGKSTTLRMIAGLENSTEGSLYIGQQRVNNVAPKDRDIAMVFQNYALYPHMTVFNNLAFGLRRRRVPKDEIQRRVHAASEILGIESILKNKPKQLSGGQSQRVAVGRAIVRKPKVFLFDEPLSNLDAKLRVQMRSEITDLHKRLGSTMIYVTHDQVEAMTMGDRIVVMNKGHIQQADVPMALYERPANLFVAGFIGSPSMNFLSGKISGEHATEFVIAGAKITVPLLESQAAALKPYAGRDVTLGIRPEDIYMASSPRRPEVVEKVDATVERVESMGNESIAYTQIAQQNLIARLSPQTLPGSGETIHLAFDVSKLHFFDNDSEMVIINVESIPSDS